MWLLTKHLLSHLFYFLGQTWWIFSRAPLLGRMEEFLVSMTMACWKKKWNQMIQKVTLIQNIPEPEGLMDWWGTPEYREGGLEGVAALLADGKGCCVGQAAQLPPHPLPLQGLAGLPQRELQAHETRYRPPTRLDKSKLSGAPPVVCCSQNSNGRFHFSDSSGEKKTEDFKNTMKVCLRSALQRCLGPFPSVSSMETDP